jgi:uncharacterized membrane protein
MVLQEADNSSSESAPQSEFHSAEVGALAHLYRGESYRSTAWRVRLDSTTNWAVATTGIALSVTFGTDDASPLPMLLVGLLVSVFLLFEGRRYLYFNVWRARARLLETDFFTPMIRGDGFRLNAGWCELLAKDYRKPRHHISFASAIGRRLRRTYAWIFAIQAIAYYAKLAIHPTPLASLADVWQRATVGPISGKVVVLAGLVFHLGWIVFACATLRLEVARRRRRRSQVATG